MAGQVKGVILTRISSGDVSDSQYHLVEFSSANTDRGCVIATGGKVHGVLLDDSTSARPVAVQVTGVAPVAAGTTATAAIAEGAPLVSNAAGRAVPSTGASQHRIGFALEALSSATEAVIDVLLAPGLTT